MEKLIKKTFLFQVIIFLLLILSAGLVYAGSKKISFQSIKIDGYIGGVKAHDVWGFLYMPKNHNGSGIVLSHGSGGISKNTRNWSRLFNKSGYATFVIDHFKPRGVKNTIYNQSAVSPFEMAFDILAAGKLIKNRREISKNIFHVGWSKGAIAGLIAASELYQKKSYIKSSYNAFIEFYPLCNLWLSGISSAPIYIIHGELDDYTPIIFCNKLEEEMNSRSDSNEKIVSIINIPGAYHSFDNWNLSKTYLPVKAIRKSIDDCILVYNHNLTIPVSLSKKYIISSLKKLNEWINNCAVTGVTLEGMPEVRKKVESDVLNILEKNN